MEIKLEIKILEGCGNYKIGKSGNQGLRVSIPKELKSEGFDAGATINVYYGKMGDEKAIVLVLKQKKKTVDE